jgi:hypothetical protein
VRRKRRRDGEPLLKSYLRAAFKSDTLNTTQSTLRSSGLLIEFPIFDMQHFALFDRPIACGVSQDAIHLADAATSVNRAHGFEKSPRGSHDDMATPNHQACGRFVALRQGSRGRDVDGTLSGMDHKMTALERAFQLARSGQVSKIAEIVGSLKRDGYSTDQIQGRVLRRQLRDLIMAARREEMN